MKILNQNESRLVSGGERILIKNRDTQEEMELAACSKFMDSRRGDIGLCLIPADQYDEFKRITKRRNYDATVIDNVYRYYF